MCLYVRDLKAGEGQKLQSLLRRGKSVISVRRAQVILSLAQGMKVPAIARQVYLSEQYVRQIIQRFNEDGLASLAPRYGGGRPAEITPEQKAEIVEMGLDAAADIRPAFHAVVFSQTASGGFKKKDR